MCIAGKILGVAVALAACAYYRAATSAPALLVEPSAHDAPVPPRFLASHGKEPEAGGEEREAAGHEEVMRTSSGQSAASAPPTSADAFIVPDMDQPEWRERCNLNSTHFVPNCLPPAIINNRSLDVDKFAEFCGTEYAAVKVANQESSDKIFPMVYTIMFNNLVATALHLVAGMALTGIFLKKHRGPKPAADADSSLPGLEANAPAATEDVEEGPVSADEAVIDKPAEPATEAESSPQGLNDSPPAPGDGAVGGNKPEGQTTCDEPAGPAARPESGEKEKEKGGCKKTAMDYLHVLMSVGATLYSLGICLLTAGNFWRHGFPYFRGVWMLPPHGASYHCKSLLFMEFVYYRNLMGYLVLSCASIFDLLVIVPPILAWLGFTANFSLLSACMPVFKCLTFCCTCQWWPACCACLQYFITCRWITDGCTIMCALIQSVILQIWATVYWLVCQCQCFKAICCSIKNVCCLCCWVWCFALGHCSCLCCLNVSCRGCVLTFGVLLIILLMLPLMLPLSLYAVVAILAYIVGVAFTVALAMVPLLLVFWFITQLVVAALKVKEKCSWTPPDDPAEFMSPCTYYAEYVIELFIQLVQSGIEILGFITDFKAMVKWKLMIEQRDHASLPACFATATGMSKLASEQKIVVMFLVPVVLLFSLMWGIGMMRWGMFTMMSFFGTHFDLGWAACAVGGLPVRCVAKSNSSAWERETDLVTVSGVRMPENWPTYLGCTCMECGTNAPLTSFDNDTSCAPHEIPGWAGAPFACAAEAQQQQPKEEKERLLLSVSNVPEIKQNESDVIRPTGDGKPQYILEGRHRYMLHGVKIHPNILNTFNMKVDRPPRKGCYGRRFSEFASTLNGWCNCSSGKFVPSAADVVWRAPFLIVYQMEVIIGDFSPTDDFLLISAQDYTHMPYEDQWLDEKKLVVREWLSTFGMDPTIGASRFQGFWDFYAQAFRGITELVKTLYVETVWGHIKLVVFHTRQALRWLGEKFYTVSNAIKALTAWMDTTGEEKFGDTTVIVIFGRSLAALLAGAAASLSGAAASAAHKYRRLRD